MLGIIDGTVEIVREHSRIVDIELSNEFVQKGEYLQINPEPDYALRTLDRAKAETRGEPIAWRDYPVGTWLYYGTDEVGMGLSAGRLDRVEKRVGR